jgi:hypothetical protein
MNECGTSIDYMKKITLLLEATSAAHGPILIKESFDFVYGVGVRGLSAFETALAGKKEGDEVTFHLRREEMDGFFQHLLLPFRCIPETLHTFTLKVRIAAVKKAKDREVIKAMAEASTCGSEC